MKKTFLIIAALAVIAAITSCASSHKSQTAEPLTLLHFSDIHGCSENLERVVAYREAHDSIDDVIHTGDAVICYLDDPDIFSSVPGAERILNTIGNHDCWKGHLVWAQSDKPYDATKAEAYEKIFVGADSLNPHVALWNVTQPQGVDDPASPDYRACYYYKDYLKSGIRLFVLDCMHYDEAQHSWLNATLSDALAKDLTVVGVTHYPSSTGVVGVDCGFTPVGRDIQAEEDTTRIQYESMPEGAFNAVDRFIAGGGKFVCWLSGHTHHDFIGHVVGHPRQLQVIVDKAGSKDDYMKEDRTPGTKNQDAFNVTTIDPSLHLMTIHRVGCDIGPDGRSKSVFVYDYLNNSL